MKSMRTANPAATKPEAPATQQQQQADMMRLQQLQQQQQQQQEMQAATGKPCMQQRIAAATENVSEVYAVAQNLAAALSAKQAEIGAARAKLAQLHQQQQQMAALGAPIPDSAASRTPSPAVPSAEPAPDAQPAATNDAPAGQQQQQPPKTATSAGDAEFASLLESLLSDHDDDPDSSMTPEEDSKPAVSTSASLTPVPSCSSGSASLQTAVAPPPFAGQPSGNWRGQVSRASSFHGATAAAPAANPAASAAAGPMGLPYHACGGSRSSFSARPAYMPDSSSAGTCMPMTASFGMVPAGVPAVGRGFGGMAGPVGSAGAVLMPCAGVSVSDGMQRTAETLHSLNAMLHQVQSSIMALKQGILSSAALPY
jgi:hypothetical protein